ncbi:MAG: HAD family phosphatase [Pseudomonadota bacterium]
MSYVIFDVGRVLIEWDPRRLYRQLLPDEAAVDHFLTRICPPEWNLEQDRGRPWAEAVAVQSARHPDHADLIAAWDRRWSETVPDAIWETAALFGRLRARGVPVYGLTNFSQEKWPLVVDRFSFLSDFDDVVVSGEVDLVKPDPAIYRLLLARNGLRPEQGLFIDDSAANIGAAAGLGLGTHHFQGAAELARDLTARGLI